MSRVHNGLPTLIVVEDCDEDFEALSRIFRKLEIKFRVVRCQNIDECLDILNAPGRIAGEPNAVSLPVLILLDLNLPGTDGRDALRAIKADPRLCRIPVTVLTTSDSPRDVNACYGDGANAYLLKSLDFDDLTTTIRRLIEFWLCTAVLPTGVPDISLDTRPRTITIR